MANSTELKNTAAIAAWRAHSSKELLRLREVLNDAEPFAVIRYANVLELLVPVDDDYVERIEVQASEYPCITAHMVSYGDDDLLAILRGEVRIENLPQRLQPVDLPQGWIDALHDLCELAVPEERAASAVIPQWILDTLGQEHDDFFFEPYDEE